MYTTGRFRSGQTSVGRLAPAIPEWNDLHILTRKPAGRIIVQSTTQLTLNTIHISLLSLINSYSVAG
jgi:hypothetical protein